MIIDLTDFRDSSVTSISIDGTYDKDHLDINGRYVFFIGPIIYKGEIYRVGKEKFLHLDVIYSYEEACGRCLENFNNTEKAILTGKLLGKSDKTNLDQDGETIYYINERLDLTDYLISSVILSLPMKPLCSGDCKGLCPKCGTNFNKGQCQCDIEDVDMRLAILKDYFPEE